MEGKNEWIPAKLMDEKLFVLRDNKWIHETELMGEKVSEKEFIVRLSQKFPPSDFNDQYSNVLIQWFEWILRVSNVKIQQALNIGEKSLPGTRNKLDGYCEEPTQRTNTMVGCSMLSGMFLT